MWRVYVIATRKRNLLRYDNNPWADRRVVLGTVIGMSAEQLVCIRGYARASTSLSGRMSVPWSLRAMI